MGLDSGNPMDENPAECCPICYAPVEALSMCDQCGHESVCVLHGCLWAACPSRGRGRMKDVIEERSILAWVGEDELVKNGRIGIKIGAVPAGLIPLAAMDYHQDRLDKLKPAMEQQAATYGKRIYLVRFAYAEILDQTEAGE